MDPYHHGPWISTYTGKKVYPWNPKPEDIDIFDISLSLSRTARFRGHTKSFYSVAQHSVLASTMVSDEHRLWALLHDAPEAYIGDLPKPLKQLLPNWEEADRMLMQAVCQRYNLQWLMPAEVAQVDLLLLVTEAHLLLPIHVDDWHLKLGVSPDAEMRIVPWTNEVAHANFMTRFKAIVYEGVE